MSELETYLAQVEADDAEAARVMDAFARNDDAVYVSRGHIKDLLAMLHVILHFDADGHAFDECLETQVLAELNRLARKAMEKQHE